MIKMYAPGRLQAWHELVHRKACGNRTVHSAPCLYWKAVKVMMHYPFYSPCSPPYTYNVLWKYIKQWCVIIQSTLSVMSILIYIFFLRWFCLLRFSVLDIHLKFPGRPGRPGHLKFLGQPDHLKFPGRPGHLKFLDRPGHLKFLGRPGHLKFPGRYGHLTFLGYLSLCYKSFQG